MSPSRSTTRTRVSVAGPTGTGNSSFGLVSSLVLHVLVIGATLITFAHKLDILDETPPVVPVDLVTIADKTNIAPTVRAIPKPAPIAPAPPPEAQNFVPPAPIPEPTEPAPELAPAKPVVKPPPPPAVPKLKPETAVQPKKADAFNFNDFLAGVDKTLDKPVPKNARVADQAHRGIGLQNAMNMDLNDALRNQIEQCWSPPAGAPHPEQLIVSVELSLNPDGSVSGTPHLTADSRAAAAGNAFVRAAADAALRAIYVCQPFKLPPNRFADWRDSTVKFDPRDVAGQ